MRLVPWGTVEGQGTAGAGLLRSDCGGHTDESSLYQLNQSPIKIPTLSIPSLPHPLAALDNTPDDDGQPTASKDGRQTTGNRALPIRMLSRSANMHNMHDFKCSASPLTWRSCSAGALKVDQPDQKPSTNIHEVIPTGQFVVCVWITVRVD